jgi:hypothetical protein
MLKTAQATGPTDPYKTAQVCSTCYKQYIKKEGLMIHNLSHIDDMLPTQFISPLPALQASLRVPPLAEFSDGPVELRL